MTTNFYPFGNIILYKVCSDTEEEKSTPVPEDLQTMEYDQVFNCKVCNCDCYSVSVCKCTSVKSLS